MGREWGQDRALRGPHALLRWLPGPVLLCPGAQSKRQGVLGSLMGAQTRLLLGPSRFLGGELG